MQQVLFSKQLASVVAWSHPELKLSFISGYRHSNMDEAIYMIRCQLEGL